MELSQRRRTPSFSSSLLDAIYRSIDESDGLGVSKATHHYLFNNTTLSSPISTDNNHKYDNSNNLTSLRQAIMRDENWGRRRSRSCGGVTHHSASSSSDSSSSSATTFSSSEAESYEKDKRSRKSVKNHVAQGKRLDLDDEKPKTQKALDEIKISKNGSNKLHAMKVYEELKKSKQPVSPGARLTNFLNSIFQSNAKKVQLCSVGATKDVSFERKSKSPSSSCFSRTRRNSTNNDNDCNKINNNNSGLKRSVRFYPVSAIMDEDGRRIDHKDAQEKDPDLLPGFTGKKRVGKKSSSSLKDELQKIRDREMTCDTSNKLDLKHLVRGSYKDSNTNIVGHEEDEEDDDVWSYSSSDLFELDHRIAINAACRYREELPVYETTDVKTNQAIARGLIL